MRFIVYLIILIYFAFSFLPVYERDSLLYHLAISKVWLTNNFSSLDFSHFFYYPSLGFFFNYLALKINLPVLANLFHLLFFLATNLLIFRKIKEKNIAFLILLLFITLQPSIRFSYAAYTDFYLLFFSTASFLLIKEWYERGGFVYVFLAAVSLGVGLNTKYNIAIMGMVLFFMLIFLS